MTIPPYYHAPDSSEGSDRVRGPDEQTKDMFSYLSPEERVRPNHPLRAIRRMTDEVLRELSPRFARMYSDIGRPSIPPEQLLRALLLQGLYTVRSEEGTGHVGLQQPVSILTERRRRPNRLIHAQADEPSKQHAVVDFFHQQSLAAHRIEALEQQRTEQLLGRDGRPANVRVHPRETRGQLSQHLIGHPANRAQGMVRSDTLL